MGHKERAAWPYRRQRQESSTSGFYSNSYTYHHFLSTILTPLTAYSYHILIELSSETSSVPHPEDGLFRILTFLHPESKSSAQPSSAQPFSATPPVILDFIANSVAQCFRSNRVILRGVLQWTVNSPSIAAEMRSNLLSPSLALQITTM